MRGFAFRHGNLQAQHPGFVPGADLVGVELSPRIICQLNTTRGRPAATISVMLLDHLSLAGIAMVLELRDDNQRLRHDNQRLRQDNQRLRQELQDPAPAADLEQEER